MKAIGYQDNLAINNEKALEDITLDKPTVSGHDILVEVKAILVNPVDYKIREAHPVPEGEYAVIGWDAAGTVTAIKIGKYWLQEILFKQFPNPKIDSEPPWD